MSRVSGMGRLLNGAGRDRAFRQTLVEQRGSIWEATADYFFGVNTVDYDWSAATDEDRLTKWIYTQDGSAASDATVDTSAHTLTIGQSGGPNPLSNQRELWTIPETGTWGIAHALLEIKATRYSGVLGMKPQHGLGMRAQEDVMRRGIIAWHDATFGISNAINVGVWQGDLAGGNFFNRQANGTFDILQTVALSSASRSGGVVIFTATAPHLLEVGDYLSFGYTREFTGAAVSRSGNVVTATLGSGHGMQTGDAVTLKGSSPASFDGSFTLTGATATTVQWSQTGSDESGTSNVSDKSNDIEQAQITEIVNGTTFRYVDGKHDLASLGTSGSGTRGFPYWIEVRLEGTVVYMRTWGRHQARPAWDDATGHALVTDLDKVDQTYTVTAISRSGGIATATIGTHDCMTANRINIDVTDGSFDSGNAFVLSSTATTVSYLNPGPDTGSGGTGTLTRFGGGSYEAIRDAPTPRGSGRIAIVAAHMGTQADSFCRYGPMYGDNSAAMLTEILGQATETDVAQQIRAVKTRVLGQVVEADTAATVSRSKTNTVGLASETDVAQPVTRLKARTVAQTVETTTAFPVGESKVRAIAQATETGTGAPVTRQKTKALGLTAETDTASPVSALRSATLGQASETDLAQPIGRRKALELAPATETDTAGSVSATKQRAVNQAVEADAAQPVGRAKLRQVAQAQETGSALAVGAAKGRGVGHASEVDTALAITSSQAQIVAQVVETDVAQPVGRGKGLGQATESNVAAGLSVTKSRFVAQAVETETALAVARAKALRQVVETDTALAVAVAKLRGLVLAVEIDVAQPVGTSSTQPIGQVIETSTARPVVPAKLRPLTLVAETDLAQGLQVRKARTLQQVTEDQLALPVGSIHRRLVGQVLETDLALPVTWVRLLVIGQAVEFDLALPITSPSQAPTHPIRVSLRERGFNPTLTEAFAVALTEQFTVTVREG